MNMLRGCWRRGPVRAEGEIKGEKNGEGFVDDFEVG